MRLAEGIVNLRRTRLVRHWTFFDTLLLSVFLWMLILYPFVGMAG